MRAKARRSLNKKLRKEQADIAAASKKRGLWASIGSSLGSLLAMSVIGPGAAPLMAALGSGTLSYVGGSLGNFIAKKTKGGKIKGGRFYQGSREDLAAQIKDQIGASAVKTGLKAGLVKLGGKIDIGGAGAIGGKATATTGGSVAAGEQAASGFKFSDIPVKNALKVIYLLSLKSLKYIGIPCLALSIFSFIELPY